MFSKKALTRRTLLQAGSVVPVSTLLAACGGGGGDDHVVTDPQSAPITSNVDLSTYIIMMKHRPPGQSEEYAHMGTGFAITSKYLATNSHVVKGILDVARGMFQQGHPVTSIVALQSTTGKEVILTEGMIHPGYNGDSTKSPDVALIATATPFPNTLQLAPASANLAAGDEVTVAGFPQQTINDFADLQPGQPAVIPQASKLSGKVQTVRAFDPRIVVTGNTVDWYEYGADTAPGSSGSPIIKSDLVYGVHAMGSVTTVPTYVPGQNGQPGQVIGVPVTTAVAGAGMHIKHLHNLIQTHETGTMAANLHFTLPPPAEAINAPQNGGQTNNIRIQGPINGTRNAHTIDLTITPDGKVTGTSSYPATATSQPFTLQITGTMEANGRVEATDNSNTAKGVYRFTVNKQTGQIVGQGQYLEVEGNGQLVLVATFGPGATPAPAPTPAPTPAHTPAPAPAPGVVPPGQPRR